MQNIFYLLAGTGFGILLTRSEVINWFRIQNMFLLREAHMYLIIGSAVLTGMLTVAILKALKLKSLTGEALKFNGKQFHRGFIYGSILFGIGWSITGACPGPIFAQIGSGAWPALFTLAGALTGTYGYHLVKKYLPH